MKELLEALHLAEQRAADLQAAISLVERCRERADVDVEDTHNQFETLGRMTPITLTTLHFIIRRLQVPQEGSNDA